MVGERPRLLLVVAEVLRNLHRLTVPVDFDVSPDVPSVSEVDLCLSFLKAIGVRSEFRRNHDGAAHGLPSLAASVVAARLGHRAQRSKNWLPIVNHVFVVVKAELAVDVVLQLLDQGLSVD